MQIPLVLWGGNDINPRYYGEEPHPHTQHPAHHRDLREFSEAEHAIKAGKPIVGVCRGAQLLCVINGGKLYQHTEPHKQNHDIVCKGQPEPFDKVSAGHHQIMKPSGNYEILGWNPNETKVWTSATEFHIEKNCPEIVWWPETKCLGIQAHPEWAHPDEPWAKYIDNLMEELGIDYSFRVREAKVWI
jgi:gamma-glutamyl-gamma-aminobutyrate hydrolase PuuD